MPSRRTTTGVSLSPGANAIPWLIATAAVIGCIGLAIWATSLRSDVSEAEAQIADLVSERNQLQQAATASAYDLSPTAQGPANASGTMYITATGSGVLSAVNLPQPGDGESYQVWFLPEDEGEPIPGGTFSVDDRGVGFLLVSADVGTFRGVAISIEPEAGSTSPTGSMLLTGAGAGARG